MGRVYSSGVNMSAKAPAPTLMVSKPLEPTSGPGGRMDPDPAVHELVRGVPRSWRGVSGVLLVFNITFGLPIFCELPFIWGAQDASTYCSGVFIIL